MEATEYPGRDITVMVAPFGDRVSLTLINAEKVMQKALTREEAFEICAALNGTIMEVAHA